jgi:hypothetical protein
MKTEDTQMASVLREVASRPDANYPAIMEQAADTITRLTARVAELEAALLEMKEMAEYWINLQIGNMKAEGDISEERYNTWLALGHHSKAMSLTRAALSPAQPTPMEKT